jgi:hypothetical protein
VGALFWSPYPSKSQSGYQATQVVLVEQLAPDARGFEQTPLAVLQVPAVWHLSIAVQVTAVPPLQLPPWQVSPLVQALLSLHEAPLVDEEAAQLPLGPQAWHWGQLELPQQYPLRQVRPLWQATEPEQTCPSGAVDWQAPVPVLQYGRVPHWASLVQVALQPFTGLQAKPLHDIVDGVLQLPAPSQVAASDSTPLVQVWLAQVFAVAG